MIAVYNDVEPFACLWLRELMAVGNIETGDIIQGSIRDIEPRQLDGYQQVHLFAGIGVWSIALRLAGWPDDREVWTCSCPCQPFSSAGRRKGTADDRHLWPEAFRLIRERRPQCIVGEQVASKDGLPWLDAVFADLEGAGYACGAVDTCAAGFGAPHIRQRLYWVAYAMPARRPEWRPVAGDRQASGLCCDERMALTEGERHEWSWGARAGRDGPSDECGSCRLADAEGRDRGVPIRRRGQDEEAAQPRGRGEVGWVEHTDRGGCGFGTCRTQEGRRELREPIAVSSSEAHRPRPTNGLWRDPDWLLCRDAKWRPVEPGTFPLAHAGTFRNRVAELRGAGNALNVAQASHFVQAVIEEFP